jgi:hypothetical protein
VAKLHHKSSYKSAPHGERESDVATLAATICSFVSARARPAVLDFGDKPIPLLDGRYTIEIRSGRLWIEAWDDERSLSRRILSIDRVSSSAVDCTVHRFGGATGSLTVLDLERPQATARSIRGARQNFAEQFRRILQRQFAGWTIEALTSSPDLRRSFSANSPRAHLRRGTQHIAALACASREDEPEFLSFVLLWFDYLRGRIGLDERISLCLVSPEGAGTLTAHRLRWLAGVALDARLFRFNEHGMAGEIDPSDLGNLDTRLSSQYLPALDEEVKSLVERLRAVPGVGCCPELGGAVSIRFRGLEFARLERGKLWLGIETRDEVPRGNFERVESFAAHLNTLGNRAHTAGPPAFPERWLESQVRSRLQILDATLLPAPVHGQVLTFAGGDRELIDLLAVSANGRLAVLELKASEDIHLPIQGLDYWMRIRWHAERGELDSLFPGIPLTKQAPKLLLIAPALSFHPSNEIALRYFSPEIEVERIGVNSEWESALSVSFRLSGSQVPISHRGADES